MNRKFMKATLVVIPFAIVVFLCGLVPTYASDSVPDDAVDWAINIANDDSFTYGKGSTAHHNGCYFCGTNYGPTKKIKKAGYEKTYCCNPFVTAAYAHGGRDAKAYKRCSTGKGYGLSVSSWKSGNFKNMGKLKYTQLVRGDVILWSGKHVGIYAGNGQMVEAHSDSVGGIEISKMSESKLTRTYSGKKYRAYILRYTGGSRIGTTTANKILTKLPTQNTTVGDSTTEEEPETGLFKPMLKTPLAISSAWWNQTGKVNVDYIRKSSLILFRPDMDLVPLVKQKGNGYSIVQGGASDGSRYAYLALWKRYSNRAIIVKYDMKENNVVKYSGSLPLDHANGLTWDSKNKRLVVTHNTVHRKRVSFVNPDTLKVTGRKDIKIPKKLKGVSKKKLKKIKGFASVAYDDRNNRYIATISTIHDYLILDKKFKVKKYIYSNAHYKGDYQSVLVQDGKIIQGVTGKSANYLVTYNSKGRQIARKTISKKYELENLYRMGTSYFSAAYDNLGKNQSACRIAYIVK